MARQRLNVLVVDDDEAVAERVREWLEKDESYIVRSVQGVDDAIVVMLLRAPDVLLTDLDVRGHLQGEDLLDHVRRCYPEALRVIYSGASELQQLIDEGLAHAAIRKPADGEALRSTIGSLVHERFGRITLARA